MTNTDMKQLLKDLRNKLVPMMMPSIGVEVTYTPESLDKVEAAINRMFKPGKPMFDTSYIPFGFYLGETIVQHIPGSKWDTGEAEYIADIKVVCKGPNDTRAEVYPFRRIMKFWEDRTDGLTVMFRTLQLMSAGGLAPDNMKQGKWVNFPNGDKIRIRDKVDKEGYERKYGSGHPYN